MKSSKLPKKIFNIVFILNILFIFSKEDIFNNPLLVSETANPIPIKGASGYYYIYTSGKFIKLNPDGRINSTKTSKTYNAPFIWVSTEKNNYFIFSSSAMNRVKLDNIPSVSDEKPSITFPSSSKFIGTMKETQNSGSSLSGCLCPIELNEAIIYGRGNSYTIVFSFLKKLVSYSLRIANTNMEEKMACKQIQNGQYLCTVLYGYLVHAYLFSHLSVSSTKCQMQTSLHSQLNNLLYNHTNVDLFDIDNNNQKLVCAKKRNTLEIECLKITIAISMTTGFSSCTQTQDLEVSDIILRFPTGTTSTEECFFKNFLDNDSLLCCCDTDKIKCARIADNYDIITTFGLEFPGKNIKITFFTDSNTYGNFFIWNQNPGNALYEYLIYLPDCKDLNYTLIVHHSNVLFAHYYLLF